MQGSAPHVHRSVSVVVPVYGGAKSLAELVRRLKPVLGSLTSRFEIILINDASPDDSWAVISELAAGDPQVRGVDLMRNGGQHNALLAGIREASYDITVTMDDDLQNPPEEIPRLLDALVDGIDVVYGTPAEEQHGLMRNAASRLTKLALSQAMSSEASRHVSAFRAFRTDLRRAFADYSSPYVSIDVLLSWGTTNFTHVVVRQDARSIGSSGYSLPKLISHAMNMITGFSARPLQLASYLGFGFTALGGLILVFVLVRFALFGSSVPGFTFLASAVAMFSGIQLFALGVLGEYLARVHMRTLGRPGFVVAKRTDSPHVPS